METQFFADHDANHFNFSLKDSTSTTLTILIDNEFEFKIDVATLTVSIEDEEFLGSWAIDVNSSHHTTIDELLHSCTKLYGKLMGLDDHEHSPLYKGQEVFELENDNNDIKFVSRLRISPDDFNQDLLINCFSFLSPANCLMLSRVSKQWNKLIKSNILWRGYCGDIYGVSDLVEYSWLDQFHYEYINFVKPKFVSEWISSGAKFDSKDPYVVSSLMGMVATTKSNHCTFAFEYNQKPQTNVFGGFGISTQIHAYFGLIPKKKLPKDFNLTLPTSSPNFLQDGYWWYGSSGLLYSQNVNGNSYKAPDLSTSSGSTGFWFGATGSTGGGTMGGTSVPPIGTGFSFGGLGGGGSFGTQPNNTFSHVGQVIGVVYDVKKKTISFHLNGKDCGVAFENVDDEEFHPAIYCGHGGCRIKIHDTPKQYLPVRGISKTIK
jgi:hypothetical protein